MTARTEDRVWRRLLPVLVMESQAMGSIAVIRSLGRAGYPVHAGASRPDALGMRSNFAAAAALCPDYDDDAFLPWLRRYIAEQGIRCIVPSEGFLLAIRPVFEEFAALLPYSQDRETVYRGLSKFDLFQTILAHDSTPDGPAAHLPPYLLIDSSRDPPDEAALAKLGTPLFVKLDGIHSLKGESGATLKVETAEEASTLLQGLRGRFSKILVQGYVPGKGVGAFCLIWNGEILAKFMHLRLHEVPHTGGVSSYRMSWRHDDIMRNAVAILALMRWKGVSMMEYRWSRDDQRYYLMELNGRFWGSLHLPIFAGVDFPRMLVDAFHGHPPKPLAEDSRVFRCRFTFPLEVQHVYSCLKDRRLTLGRRLWAIIEFALLTIDPRVKSDLWFAGDRKLYWLRLRRFLRNLS